MRRDLIGSLLRFGLVGGLVTGLVYLVFIGLLKLGLHYLAAATVGWAVGVGMSYGLNRSWTFAVPNRAHAREFAAFVAGYLAQLGLGLFTYWVLIGVLKLGPTVAFVINVAITSSFSFVVMRYLVFRRSHAAHPV